MTSRWGGVVTVAAVLLVTGCAGLTVDGPVEPGLEVGSDQGPALRVSRPGPVTGASQEEIVRGFLRAGAASDGAYDSARAFLTTQARDRWNPDDTLVVLAAEAPSTTLVDPATVRVSVAAAGTIDGTGRYTAAAPSTRVSVTFSVTSVSGQWRIDELPEDFGRWIPQPDVSRLVQPFAVHYVATSRRFTVPDVRWFPRDRLATRLARAQLADVPAYLRGAAVTAVPSGARLLGDAVSVEDGTARVNLISRPLDAGENTRENLWAQFVSTLLQDPLVSRVELAVNSVPVDLAGLDGPAATLDDLGLDTTLGTPQASPVVRRGAEVSVFDPADGTQPSPPGERTYPAVPVSSRKLALSIDGAELAAVDDGGTGVSRWRGGRRFVVAGLGSAVGGPAYDRRGYLWMGAVADAGRRLFVVDSSADPADPDRSRATAVRADWLAGRQVLEAKTASDGDRLAVLSVRPDGGDARVDISGITRGAAGRPEALAPPLRLGIHVRDPIGLAWLDDRTLATLGVLTGSGRQPLVLTVGGEVRPLTPVAGAVRISSTGGERDVYVTTAQGALVRREGSQWTSEGQASDLAVAAG
ncbi:MAG: GerMN domain-containing protein [Dermatophilaceae bacterium]